MKRKKRKEVELYVPKGYTFEELYDGDDTGYGFEEESPALQEEVKIRYECSSQIWTAAGCGSRAGGRAAHPKTRSRERSTME